MSLIIQDLTLALEGKTILKQVNLELNEGELIAVLGCNGVGKSTLFKALMGLIPYDGDNIFIKGKSLKQSTQKQRGQMIAYMPQQTLIGEAICVREFLIMGFTPVLGLFEVPKREHYEKVDELLTQLKLEHLATRLVDSLSGGERQSVYLGRMLIQNTQWMVLDEPTASLDYKRQHEVLHLIRELAHCRSKGIVFSVHDPNLALNYADRLLVMDKGCIVGDFRTGESLPIQEVERLLRSIYQESLELILYHNKHIIVWNN